MRQGAVYRQEWGTSATLYAGLAGSLPAIGEEVMISNAYNGAERVGIVTARDTQAREYTVVFAGQLAINLEEVRP